MQFAFNTLVFFSLFLSFNSPALADEGCKVFVDLQYPKYKSRVADKLVAQGFTIVGKLEDANFQMSNYKCFEKECALTAAELDGISSRGIADRPVLEVRGYDKIQFLFTRRHLANRLTLKLIEILPTCEQVKTMPYQYVEHP